MIQEKYILPHTKEEYITLDKSSQRYKEIEIETIWYYAEKLAKELKGRVSNDVRYAILTEHYVDDPMNYLWEDNISIYLFDKNKMELGNIISLSNKYEDTIDEGFDDILKGDYLCANTKYLDELGILE